MSSWDSSAKLNNRFKIKGVDKSFPLYYRIVYDTPSMISYSVLFKPQDLEEAELFEADTLDDWVELRSWSRENNNIDADAMNDYDVYDYFSKYIEPYLSKLENDGLSVKQITNILKNEGIEAKYIGPKIPKQSK